jgi:otoferlin
LYWIIISDNKPSFGPTHIHFYEGVHKNLFYGKVLISIETEEIDEKFVSLLQHKQDILMPLNETEYWNDEIFKINMILVNMDALNLQQQNRIKVYLSCENIFSNTVELETKAYDGKMKVKFVQFNSTDRPLLSMSIKLPDNRIKLQMKNLIRMLVHEMVMKVLNSWNLSTFHYETFFFKETNIKNYQLFEARYHNNVDYQSKCLTMFLSDLKDMLEGMKTKIYYKTFKKLTNWDENYLKFLQSIVEICIVKIHDLLTKSFTVKTAFDEYVNIRDKLVETLNEVDGSGPDIFLNVTSDGKLLAFHRFKMTNYFHSQAFDARGQNCGKLHSILVKPSSCIHSCTNCGCFFGKFEKLLWIGSEKEISEWLPQNTIEMASNKINFTIERFYKCNVYVHQAKIQPGADKSGLSDPKLVITASGMHERTRV